MKIKKNSRSARIKSRLDANGLTKEHRIIKLLLFHGPV